MMKMLVINRKITLSILMILLLCGLQGVSSAADPPAVELQVETEQVLTSVNSNNFVVTLSLEGATWAESSEIRQAVEVSGIDGIEIKEERYNTGRTRRVWVCTSWCGSYIELGYWTTRPVYDYRPSTQRKSDTVLEVPLIFDDTDFDTDVTLTFTVKASAIVNYNGASLTAIMPIITAVSAPLPLTEQNLQGSVVRFTLTGGKYAAQLLDDAVTVAGIDGVGVSDVVRKSDTVLEVPLTFDGTDFDTDATLALTVSPDAIENYSVPVTAMIPVTALIEGVFASATPELTEATLNEGVVTLTLNFDAYETDITTIMNAVTVTGVDGVTIDTASVQRLSNREITVGLNFDLTDFDTDTALSFKVAAGAIADYTGDAFTAEIVATAIKEVVSASAESPLTEATLDEGIVSLVLTGAAFEQDISKIQEAVTVSGINGLTIDTTTLQRTSDRKVTVDLDFDGTDFDTDTALTFSLTSGAIANHNEKLSTELPVTAIVEAVAASVVSPLTEETLDGSIVTLNLTGIVYEQDISKIREAVSVSGINGVTVDTATVQRLGDKIVAVELEYDDTDFVQDTELTFSVAAGAITNYDSTAFTTELSVTANRNEDILTIFWTDGGTEKIQRANLDGSNIEDLITQGLNFPANIVLDIANGKMYWTDSGTDKIQRANLDGSNIEDLVTQGLEAPNGIVLDVEGGKMYWTDYRRDIIQRANLDGSNIEDLVTQGLYGPNSLVLDIAGGRMYWTDVGTDKIQRANLDGSNIEDLVTQGLEAPNGIAIGNISPVNPTTETEESTIRKEDVNGDGVVDVNDLVIVAKQYGKTDTNDADVNGDEIVNVDDFILVAAAVDSAASAPTARAQVQSHFTKAQLQGWLTEARASGNTSRTYQQGIAFVERLLALFAPEDTAPLPNFPNPFNPETWIPYHLSKDADVSVHIYAVNGTLVRTL